MKTVALQDVFVTIDCPEDGDGDEPVIVLALVNIGPPVI